MIGGGFVNPREAGVGGVGDDLLAISAKLGFGVVKRVDEKRSQRREQ